jgi:hypothetical protein
MIRITLIVLHVLVGIMAVGAGQALAMQPDGAALGFPVDWLAGSPFPDYRFPGLFLAVVIGGANLVSAFALLQRYSLGPMLSLATGLLLIAWISIQTTIIGYEHWTQIFWFALFIGMTVLAGIAARGDPTLRGSGPRGRRHAHTATRLSRVPRDPGGAPGPDDQS